MKQFTDIFNQIAYRHDFMRVFDDFLTLAICCFSCGRMEDIYLSTIKGYSKDEIKNFSFLLGSLILDYEKRADNAGTWYDGLGDFFMENNSKFGQDAKGQFFTPVPVCDMIARMNFEGDNREERHILDPAAGSGRMLIAFDRQDANFRFQNFYVAADIDSRCIKMCALNFCLYGLKGAIIHMDSLKMEIWGGYRVFMPETGLGVKPLDKMECMQFIFQPTGEIKVNSEHPPEPNPVLKPVKLELIPERVFQLSLF
jgi:type I restriction enzyme M protein